MTQEGRDILLRVEIHCAEQWGVALWEMETEIPRTPRAAVKPLDSVCWHMALRTIRSLRLIGRGII
jgi:hypothetical protein